STSSKAFRVYNKRTKRVEENLHINFLDDQPNVVGTGPNWMFDLDLLTSSMNYIPVSVENQVIVVAGTQDSYVAGSSGNNKGPTQEYILLPLQPHRTRIPVKEVVQDAQEQSFENASPDKDELEIMVTQELVANAMNDESRQAFEGNTPPYSAPHSPPHSPPYSAPLPEVTRINSLEKELKETKQTLGNDVLKLVKKVKSLEKALKRKSKKVLISESEGEEPEDQGRIIQDIDDDPLVSLVRESMKEKST
ncbi:hypothetical protein Tco_0130706, partial [Tanacetum coccineum]